MLEFRAESDDAATRPSTRDAQETSREATKAKALSFGKLKHELRTPINHIIGYSEILLEEAADHGSCMPPTFISDLERIHACGKVLLTLVEDIFSPVKYPDEYRGIEATTHHLRCQLNSIIGYCEMLLEDFQAAPQQLFAADLQKVHSAGKVLCALIEGISARGNISDAPAAEAAGLQADDLSANTSLVPNLPERVFVELFNGAGQQGCTVLVVDDDENNRDMLSRRLEHLGYGVRCAHNGLDALEKMRCDAFDLVLLDVMMPVLDGYQTLEQIKSDTALRDTPVIMISALDDLAFVSACIEIGAEDYLPKSFDPVILKARVSASLERKRLRQAELQVLELLRKELQTASQIQANMLPSRFPLFPQCREIDVFASMTPAKVVGGDFYDAFFVETGKVFIAVGDVSGKGIPAALFMVQSMTHLRMQALRALPPHRILFEVNNLLCCNNDAGMFVTLFCGILDLATGVFSYSNAGHIPPVWCKEEGVAEFVDLPRGVVAGIVENFVFGLERLKLTRGQSLFVYTDGVSEAENLLQELYSEHRLRKFLASSSVVDAKAAVDAVTNDIVDFVGGAAQSDDITMLAFRYLG